MATYTQRQAAKIVGLSRTTLGRHIASGRVSCSRNDDGSVSIDASELVRVYGDQCKFDRAKQGAATIPGPSGDGPLQEAHAKLDQLHEKLLRQYRDEIDHLKEALAKAQEGQVRVTALLEGQRDTASEWRSAMEELSEKIANQTDTKIKGLKERHEEELLKLKRALRAEREKGLWTKLIGR